MDRSSVYSCMTNGGIIEGNTEYSGFSDLNLAISYAGRWTNIPEQSLLLPSGQCKNSGGSGATLRAVSLRKPAIEKEARLRSQHFTFGSGETRMQMRSWQRFGGIDASTPPRSHNFMKYLVILIVGVSTSYGQQFNGTIFDLDTGRIQVINGNFSRTGDWKTDAMIEFNESYHQMRMEREMREQTRLLREMANQ